MSAIGTVDLGCIACLLGSVTEQHKADVLHSTLLAQLHADRTCSRTADSPAWGRAYHDTLQRVFWVRQDTRTERFPVRGRALLLEDVVLRQLRLATSENAVALVAQTLTAFRLLPRDADPVMRFNTEVTDGDGGGNFQVLLATASDDEGPTMHLTDIAFRTSAPIDDPLLEPLPPGDDTTVRVSALTAVLNESGYAPIRASVDDKLGTRVRTDIMRIYELNPQTTAA